MESLKVCTAPTADGALIVSVEGEIDIATVEQLAEPVGEAVVRGRDLVLDLSGCSFIDSTGLAFVLRTHSALSEAGNALAVVAGQGEVRKLLYLTAIDRSVPVFAARGDAVALLGARGVTGVGPPRRPSAAPISTTGGPSA